MQKQPRQNNPESRMEQEDGSLTSLQPLNYDNPFTGIKTLPPNIPMSDGGAHMMDALLDDSTVPERKKEKFFWVFHRDNVLTFLDDERKVSKIMAFDILKIDTLNKTPYYDYDFNEELQWNVMRNIFETKLDRARGIDNGNSKNERIIEQSQFSENRQIQQNDMNDTNRDSFLKRLLSKR